MTTLKFDASKIEPGKPVLVFRMTDFEQGAILPAMRSFGEQLAVSLGDQLERHVPGFDRVTMIMSREEIMGRALACIGGLDPEEFGARIAGSQLKIQVVASKVPCPACTDRRVAMNAAKCRTCKGARQVAMLIPPDDRLVPEEDIKPKLSLVGPNGKSPLS